MAAGVGGESRRQTGRAFRSAPHQPRCPPLLPSAERLLCLEGVCVWMRLCASV